MSGSRRSSRNAVSGRRSPAPVWRRLVALALLSTAVAACAGDRVAYTDLDGELDRLVAAFNDDVGKVRAVLLAAPT